MVKLKMLCTYASPEVVLLEGKTYSVNDELADKLLAVGSGKVENEASAKLAAKGSKVTKIPAQPDPGDTGELEVDDEEEPPGV